MSTDEPNVIINLDVSHLMYPLTKLEKAVYVYVDVMPRQEMVDYIYRDFIEYYEKVADPEERDELIEMYEPQYKETK
jgi:hypothetical protein